MTGSFRCPYCGAENMPGYQFCAACGQRFEYRCPQCGAAVIPSNRECPACNTGLHWAITGTQDESGAQQSTEMEHTAAPEDKKSSAAKIGKRGPAGLWLTFFGTVILVAILIMAGLYLFNALPWGLDRFVPEVVQPHPAAVPPQDEPVPPPVLPVSAPEIISFDVSPQTITPAQEALLAWKVSEADSVTIDSGVGEVDGEGTVKVSPDEDTVYTLTAQNAAGSSSVTVQLSVIGNMDARAIALADDEVEGTGFTYYVRISPSIPDTISTHEVEFAKGYELIDNKVFIFNSVNAAQDYYFNVKSNNRVNIKEQPISIGQRAFILQEASEHEGQDTLYTIKFQKNNVFVSMGRIDDFELLESLARIVESRID